MNEYLTEAFEEEDRNDLVPIRHSLIKIKVEGGWCTLESVGLPSQDEYI